MDGAHEQDRSDMAIFVCGLLTGATLGTALTLLFAPKPGREMRRDITKGMTDVSQTAREKWGDVQAAASSAVKRGRDAFDLVKGTAERVADSAEQSAEEITDTAKNVVTEIGTAAAEERARWRH